MAEALAKTTVKAKKKATNKLRTLVSVDRYRYKEGEYNLDLTYITPRIIAMATVGEGLESVWRNHIDNVARFLTEKHEGRYLIFNLSEKSYDYSKFNNAVMEFGFPDHHPPPLSMLFQCMVSMDSWLQADPLNVAVVHCKGGKGRKGTVIASYLIYDGMYSDAASALDHFAEARSKKMKGVSNPSQRRYVEYFTDILINRSVPVPTRLCLQKVVLTAIPSIKPDRVFCRPRLRIYENTHIP